MAFMLSDCLDAIARQLKSQVRAPCAGLPLMVGKNLPLRERLSDVFRALHGAQSVRCETRLVPFREKHGMKTPSRTQKNASSQDLTSSDSTSRTSTLSDRQFGHEACGSDVHKRDQRERPCKCHRKLPA